MLPCYFRLKINDRIAGEVTTGTPDGLILSSDLGSVLASLATDVRMAGKKGSLEMADLEDSLLPATRIEDVRDEDWYHVTNLDWTGI